MCSVLLSGAFRPTNRVNLALLSSELILPSGVLRLQTELYTTTECTVRTLRLLTEVPRQLTDPHQSPKHESHSRAPTRVVRSVLDHVHVVCFDLLSTTEYDRLVS